MNTRILAQAFNYGMSANDWSMVLERLFPLIVQTDIEGEYALFHNDFRVFLMGGNPTVSSALQRNRISACGVSAAKQ